jgi:hypothetical protein
MGEYMYLLVLLLFLISVYLIFSAALCPGVYSASNRNEYQKQKKFFWGVQRGLRIRLTTSPPSVSQLSRQFGILNISQPNMPPRPLAGIALILLYNYYRGSTALLLGLGRFFSFLIPYTVSRTPCKGDKDVARPLRTHRTTQTHKNT